MRLPGPCSGSINRGAADVRCNGWPNLQPTRLFLRLMLFSACCFVLPFCDFAMYACCPACACPTFSDRLGTAAQTPQKCNSFRIGQACIMPSTRTHSKREVSQRQAHFKRAVKSVGAPLSHCAARRVCRLLHLAASLQLAADPAQLPRAMPGCSGCSSMLLQRAAGASVLGIMLHLGPGLAVAALLLWHTSECRVDVFAAAHPAGLAWHWDE